MRPQLDIYSFSEDWKRRNVQKDCAFWGLWCLGNPCQERWEPGWCTDAPSCGGPGFGVQDTERTAGLPGVSTAGWLVSRLSSNMFLTTSSQHCPVYTLRIWLVLRGWCRVCGNATSIDASARGYFPIRLCFFPFLPFSTKNADRQIFSVD